MLMPLLLLNITGCFNPVMLTDTDTQNSIIKSIYTVTYAIYNYRTDTPEECQAYIDGEDINLTTDLVYTSYSAYLNTHTPVLEAFVIMDNGNIHPLQLYNAKSYVYNRTNYLDDGKFETFCVTDDINHKQYSCVNIDYLPLDIEHWDTQYCTPSLK